MLKRFYKYKKYKEIFNMQLIECRIAIILTISLILLFEILDLYNEFELYENAFQNISIYIASALIGMLGIILAGVAFMTSSLNKENIKSMNKVNGENIIEKVLVSFEFIAFLVAIEVVIFFVTYVILFSDLNLFPKNIFYIFSLIIIYMFIFTILYIVVLVGDSIQFFILTTTYDEIAEMDKSIISIANELRIDFIMKVIIENNGNDSSKILDSFMKYCNEADFEKKQDVIDYLKKTYEI